MPLVYTLCRYMSMKPPQVMRILPKFPRIRDIELNNINDTDSYKLSHFLLYEDDLEYMESYLESRGGEFDECTLFGLQYVVHRYLSKPITAEDIDEMERDANAHGEPFNREGWTHVLNAYGGMLPITIRAIPEGTVVPVKNAIMVVRGPKDRKCAWIVNWLETQLSRLWEPSTIAIASRELKKVWMHYLELSSDDPAAEVGFKHHDFGARGVTCREQASIAGAAHLLSFLGTDTLAGVKFAQHYYNEEMPGFSIPATEHSTMTIPGKERERETLIRWIRKTLVERKLPPGYPKLSACVGDTWDIFNFVKTVCDPEVFDLIDRSGGTLVIRPDSGNPLVIIPQLLNTIQSILPHRVVANSKGFKVLPPCLRLIWGDGINRRTMREILEQVMSSGWSVSNIAFGSGGGLLMDFNRDTQRFAFKCSYAVVGGRPVNVSKDPVTDRGKKSKEGRLDLVKVDGRYSTVVLADGMEFHPDTVMVTYFENGHITYNTTFAAVRARMSL